MSAPRRLPRVEFVFLTAMLFASIALAIDGMLPGLPHIGAELSPDDPNRAQFVVTTFLFGMGAGTLIAGPVSDAFGRKPVIFAFSLFYFAGAGLSYAAGSLEVLIAARVLMGFGAAGPRAIGLAIVRDIYAGREMAKLMSFTMMVFSLVPAIAPLLGSFIIDIWGWREVFLGFILFTICSISWLMIRQPETLEPQNRVPLKPDPLWHGILDIFSRRVVVLGMLVLALCFGLIFMALVTIQPVYDITFNRAESFPWWFALTSVLAMTGSVLNARLVDRLGMRVLVSAALAFQAVFAGTMALTTWAGLWPPSLAFPAFFIWITSIFWMVGLTIGNLNALALEPLGHIAGLAASVVSASATVLSILVAAPVGLAFDGTPVPVMTGVAVTALAAFVLMRFAGAGRGPSE